MAGSPSRNGGSYESPAPPRPDADGVRYMKWICQWCKAINAEGAFRCHGCGSTCFVVGCEGDAR